MVLFVILDLNGTNSGDANLPSPMMYLSWVVRFRQLTSWVSIKMFTGCLLDRSGLQVYCFMSCHDINPRFGYGVLELKCSSILFYVTPSLNSSLLKKVKMILKEIHETSSVSSVRYILYWDGLVLSGCQYFI